LEEEKKKKMSFEDLITKRPRAARILGAIMIIAAIIRLLYLILFKV
jgi:hypothetical protein